jgi:N6-L-threonylcarbamoyladenine synthase
MYAALLDDPDLEPPFVTLIVSGGHTLLVAMDDHGSYRVLGRTVDDAAGEAFDKVARFLGLGYPGGPAIDRLASQGDPAAIAFPRPMLAVGNDFSFSADVAASFQAAVVDVLVAKLLQVVEEQRVRDPRMTTVVIGGGVAANSSLRARLVREGARGDLRVVLPSIGLCTDNAAMVASTAWWRLASDGPTPLDAGAYPGLRIA